MTPDQIFIILCSPDESRNIGSACRAMKNMGLSQLRIVGEKKNYDDEKVRTLALHASDVWKNSVFYSNIADCISDLTIAAATTRRRGKKRNEFLQFPDEFAQSITRMQQGKIGILFGNERTGLTDEEISYATTGITIPTADDFPSLNLSHAVQVVCYELFRALSPFKKGYTPVSISRIEQTSSLIGQKLSEIGFFTKAGRPDMEKFWRSLLSRAAVSERETAYIEKLFNKIAGMYSASAE